MKALLEQNPWMTAAERIYGPLADALGLRLMRQVGESWCQLATAQCEELVANAQLAGVCTTAAVDGVARLTRRLERLGSDGETIASPTAMLRISLRELDGAMHAAMLSDSGLAATAASVRAASRRRIGWQKASAIGAETMGQPTRAEVDEAFREIAQLKRKLRRLEGAAGRTTEDEA